MTETLASWWTPTGWEWAPRPAPYDFALSDESVGHDWNEDLQKAGYNNHFSINKPDDGMSLYHITTWMHPGDRETQQHLFVEIWDCDGSPAFMFVAQRNIAPFFFDKLPELIRNQRDINAPSIAKALVAFIRHGHGPLTICEYGEENKDERERRLQSERRRKAEFERKAAQERSVTSP